MLNVKVGDKVKSCLRGWGTVKEIDVDVDRDGFIADFGDWNVGWFSSCGRFRLTDEHPEIVEIEKKKWRPEGGEHYLAGNGEEINILFNEVTNECAKCVNEGRIYKTRTQLLKAHKMIRSFQRLVAWVLENVPHYDPDNKNNNYIVVKNDLRYEAVFVDNIQGFEVRMPRLVAKKLVDKLNSGEVDL